MTRGLLFWVLMLIWLLLWLWVFWPDGGSFKPLLPGALLFAVIALLGWQVYGPAVKG